MSDIEEKKKLIIKEEIWRNIRPQGTFNIDLEKLRPENINQRITDNMEIVNKKRELGRQRALKDKSSIK